MRRMIATFEPELVPVSKEPLSIAETFRANVNQLMEEQSVSQMELANRLSRIRGVTTSRSRVSDILNRPHDPGLEWVELFARALGVHHQELLSETMT